jgi:hypothetical protein
MDRQSEIADLGDPIAVDQDILGFDIPVVDPTLVRKSHRSCDLNQNVDGTDRFETSRLQLEPLSQVLPLDIFLNDINP